MSSGDDDTAMTQAFRKASLSKLAKKAAKRLEREKAKEERLAKVREKTSPDKLAEKPPEPVAASTEVALQVQTQHYLQDKVAREKKIRELTRIASRGETVAKPAPIEPEPKPITPDDPRVKNGTLAPSPKVAKLLESRPRPELEEGAADIGNLQRSAFPDGWREILATGTPERILAGRKKSQLNADELEAYRKAYERRFASVRGERTNSHQKARTPSARYRRTPFGAVVEEYRLAAGLTTKEVAKLAGITPTQFNALVSQVAKPKRERVEAVCRALDIPEEKIVMNGTAEPSAHAKKIKAAMRAHFDSKPLDPRWYTPVKGDTALQLALKNLVRENNIKPKELAQRAGVYDDLVRKLLSEPGRWTRRDKLEKIAAVFGKTLAELDPASAMPPAPFPDPALRAPSKPAEIEAEPEGAEIAAEPANVIASPSLPAFRPPIEKGVPIPAFMIRSSWYRWTELDKGDSFLAPCPAGMAWEDFVDRIVKMADRQAEKLNIWLIHEAYEEDQFVRIWRIM